MSKFCCFHKGNLSIRHNWAADSTFFPQKERQKELQRALRLVGKKAHQSNRLDQEKQCKIKEWGISLKGENSLIKFEN